MNTVRSGLLALALLLSSEQGAAADVCSGAKSCDVLVDVLDARLRFHVRPGTSTTVLFEAGSGLGADAWQAVIDAMPAGGPTLIAYDRAGMGRSDGLETPYDVHDEMLRLHAALQEMGRDRDLVLVGHSYGGYLIHLYANLYPGDLHGLVYVDANTVAGIDALGGPGPIAEARIRANQVPQPDKAQKAGLRLSRALVATHETVRRYPVVCGVPVIVLSAGQPPDGMPSQRFDAWLDAHRGLARAANGEWRMAERSGHMVPRDQPQAVVDAVQDVLARATTVGARPGRAQSSCAEEGSTPSARTTRMRVHH